MLAADISSLAVIPALDLLVPAGIPNTKTAHDLLMGTWAQESLGGAYLMQYGGGPGVGMWMMTPSEIPSLLARCSQPQLAAIALVSTPEELAEQLPTNLLLAAMIARLFYWQVPAGLPADTVSGLWNYYKRYYNTFEGAATEAEWRANWRLTGIVLPA